MSDKYTYNKIHILAAKTAAGSLRHRKKEENSALTEQNIVKDFFSH